MTDHATMFDEMDQAADAMLSANPDMVVLGDLQIEFRAIQKARMPDLNKDEWLDLFATWHESYTARLKAKHDDAIARLIAMRYKLPPGKTFICPCGASLRSFGPEEAALHGEHIFLAQFDQRQQGQ